MDFDSSFTLMSTLFPIIFLAVFGIIIGTFVAAAVRGAKQYRSNNASPRLTVGATVVTKRSDVTYYHHRNNDNMTMDHASSSTSYYVTFEVESGDRMEFLVDSREFGMLVEGDQGQLSFQGTRYQGFLRQRG